MKKRVILLIFLIILTFGTVVLGAEYSDTGITGNDYVKVGSTIELTTEISSTKWTVTNGTANVSLNTTTGGTVIVTGVKTGVSKIKAEVNGRTYRTVVEVVSDEKYKYIKAVEATAKAYYNRKTDIQYDSLSMTYQSQSGRKAKFRNGRYTKHVDNVHYILNNDLYYYYSPEDATEQDRHYMVCSDVPVRTYYETFYKINESGETEPYIIKDGKNVPKIVTANLIDIANPNCVGGDADSTQYNPDLLGYYKKLTQGDWDAIPSSRTTPLTESQRNQLINFVNEIRNNLQPGDILLWRRTHDTGHAMLYVGNGMIVHAGGTSDKYNMKYKSNTLSPDGGDGTLVCVTDIFRIGDTIADSGFIANNFYKKTTDSIGTLKPLNDICKTNSGYHLTSNATARLSYPNLYCSKIASVEKYQSVNPGAKITYTIILENRGTSSNPYNPISVEDFIPANTTYVSHSTEFNGTYNESTRKLNWSVSLSSGQNATLTYTVSVNSDVPYGTKIVNDKTKVTNIKLNTIETVVNRTLSSTEQKVIKDLSSKSGETTYSLTKDFINSVYREFEFGSVSNTLNKFFNTASTLQIGLKGNGASNPFLIDTVGETSGEIKKIYKLKDLSSSTDKICQMYVEGLFGGLYTVTEKDVSKSKVLNFYDGRNYTYDSKTLMIGDILIVVDDDYATDKYVAGEKNMYLYIGANKFATVKNGVVKIIQGSNVPYIYDEDKESHSGDINVNTGARLIDSLLGQNCFIVLRPSYSMTKTLKPEGENYRVNNDTSTSYKTLAEAYEVAKDSGDRKIIVLQDVTDSSTLTIENGKSVTISTNGNRITRTKSITNEGTLSIIGNGEICTSSSYTQQYLINNKGILNIANPTLCHNGISSSNWYTIYGTSGEININNGTVKTEGNGSDYVGNVIAVKGNTVLNVNGGNIYSSNGTAIISNATSSGGNITGEININGGTITVEGEDKAGIQTAYSSGYTCNTSVKVLGGTITSKNGPAIKSTANNEIIIGAKDSTVSISTPIIQGKTYGVNVSSNGFKYYDGKISGATSAISGTATDLEDGYSIIYKRDTIENTNYETAYLSQNANYSVGNKYYTTLEEAYNGVIGLDNAGTTGTIKVERSNFADISTFEVEAGKNITLDMNGNTVEKRTSSIKNKGTLSIINSGRLVTSNADKTTALNLLISNSGTLNIGETGKNGPTLVNKGISGDSYWYTIRSSSGEINVKSGRIESSLTPSSGSIVTTNNEHGRSIYLYGNTDLNISGGIVISSCQYAIMNYSNDSSTGTMTITGGEITSTTNSAIYINAASGRMNDSELEVTAGTITGSKNGILLGAQTSGNLIITGGTIIGGESNSAVSSQGTGEFTLGTKDGSVNANVPKLKGYYGLNSANGFNFYDGKIIGTSYAYSGTILDKENGYIIISGTEEISGETYKTAKLQQTEPNPTVVNAVTGLTYGDSGEIVTISNIQGTTYYAVDTELTSSNYLSAGNTTIPTASGKDTGSHTVYYYIPASGIYEVKSGNVNVDISTKALSITANNQTIISGDSIATGTSEITCDGLIGTDTVNEITLTRSELSIVPSSAVIKSGTKNVTSNYDITYINGEVIIDVPYIQIEVPVFAEKVYDGTLQTLEPGTGYSISGEISATNVGTYSVTVILNDGYEWTDGTRVSKETTWDIVTAKVTKPTLSGTYAYNGNEQEATLNNVNESVMTVTNNTRTKAGTQNIVVALKDKTNYTWSDDTTADLSIEWTIEEKALTIIARDQEINEGNDIEQGTDYIFVQGLVGEDEVTDITLTQSGDSIVPSGITIKNGATNVTSSYDITYENGSLTIILNIKIAVPTFEDVTYDGESHTIEDGEGYVVDGETIAITTGLYTITVLPMPGYAWTDGSTVSKETTWRIVAIKVTKPTLSGTYTYNGSEQEAILNNVDENIMTVTNNTRTNTGTQNITVALKDKTNYTWSGDNTADLSIEWTIGKKALTVTAKNQEINQGGSIEQGTWNVSVNGLVGGHELGSIVLTQNANSIVPSGAVVTDGSGDVTSNYEVSYEDGALTIIPNIKIAVPTFGNITYDGEEHSIEDEDEEEYSLNGEIYGTEVGSYTVTVTPNIGYEWMDGTTVPKEVTWNIVARKVTKPTLSGTYIYNGSEQEATLSNVNTSIMTVTNNTGTNAETRNIVISLKDKTNYTWSDDTTTDLSIEWTIGKKALTVTAKDQTIKYGDDIEQSVEEVLVDGLIDGHELSDITLTISGESIIPSEAVVTNGSGDVTSNYEVTYEDGTLTIIPNIKIAVPTFEDIVYDGEEHTLSSGEGYTLSGDVSATDAGEYVVIAILDKYYEWTDETMTNKEIIWHIVPAKVTKPTLSGTYTYNGSEQQATLNNVNANVITVTNNTRTNAGMQNITIALKDKTNYTWSDDTTTDLSIEWIIEKKALTVTAKNQEIHQGDSIEQGVDEVSVNGLINGHELSEITLTQSGESITPSSATITNGSGDVTSNYEVTYEDGALTVIPNIKIAVPTFEKIMYDGEEHVLPSGEGYTLSGDTSATDVGVYSVIITLKSYYEWEDGTTDPKTIEWNIYMRGDVDRNGELSIVDVRMLLQKVVNESYTEDEMDIVDFNIDDEVSIIDVRMLLQHIINN